MVIVDEVKRRYECGLQKVSIAQTGENWGEGVAVQCPVEVEVE